MKLKKTGIIIAFSLGFLLLVLFLTYQFIPDSQVRELITTAAAEQGYTVHAAYLGKALPFGVKGENVEVASASGPLIKADYAVARLRLLPLLWGRLIFSFRADIAGGKVTGETSTGAWQAEIEGVRLNELPMVHSVTGSDAKGEIFASGHYGGSLKDGEIKFEIRNLDLRGVKISGIVLPDAGYNKSQGMIRISHGRAVLESVTLQGTGLYVRLKGSTSITPSLPNSPLDFVLELMPRPEFMDSQKLIFLVLAKYLDTPGHYQIPIGGVLGSPAIR